MQQVQGSLDPSRFVELVGQPEAASGQRFGVRVGEHAQTLVSRGHAGPDAEHGFARQARVVGDISGHARVGRQRLEQSRDLAVHQPATRLRQLAVDSLTDQVVREDIAFARPGGVDAQQGALFEPFQRLD